MSLAASRRQNDGPRRVSTSFNETRITSSRLYDDSEDEEESEEQRLQQQQEDDEERRLSEKFGEAEEGPSSDNRKRKSAEESEKDIADALAQEEKKKLKKPRPQLLTTDLTGADGLMKIPIEFKKKLKYKPRPNKKRDIVAAAAYSRNLVNAYHNFCTDLFPSMAFEDVLLKIEQLGSKKEIKDFLQHTRENLRNEHLERLYGREKAEQMLQELDEGLKMGLHGGHGYDDDNDDLMMQPSTISRKDEAPEEQQEVPTTRSMSQNIESASKSNTTTGTTAPTPSRQPKLATNAAAMSDDEEQEATFGEEDDAMDIFQSTDSAKETIPEAAITKETTAVEVSPAKETNHKDDSDDNNEEMILADARKAVPGTDDRVVAENSDDKQKSTTVEADTTAEPSPNSTDVIATKNSEEDGPREDETEEVITTPVPDPDKNATEGDSLEANNDDLPAQDESALRGAPN